MSLAKHAIGAFALALTTMVSPCRGEDAKETLIHEGPAFDSPSDDGRGDLRFSKEFVVDADLWQRQQALDAGHLDQPLGLSAEKAIELARASAETGSTGPQKNVVKLELLTRERENPKGSKEQVPYYLIEMRISGSEVHRIVLMDGTVVKSRLRPLPKP